MANGADSTVGIPLPRGTLISGYCAHCKEPYTGTRNQCRGKKRHGPRKYCSRECQHQGMRKALARVRPVQFLCGNCGDEFLRKPRGGDKYCSRKCYFEWKRSPEGREHTRQAALVQFGALVVAKAYREHTGRGYRLSLCEACQSPHDRAGVTCSQECGTARFLQYQWQTETKGKVNSCLICGVEWCNLLGGGANRKYCSDDCRLAGHQDQKRSAKRQRRLRLTSLDADRISRRAVFERDEWTCQACGCDAPERLQGTYEDDAPELDHIVPLSKGGCHTYDNVQLLCRVCNILKANKDWDVFRSTHFIPNGIKYLTGGGRIF